MAATFAVRPGDGVMLVTDGGRLIRVPSDQVRVTGRQTMGVTLFRLDERERVTSVFPILEDDVPEAEIPDGDAAIDDGPIDGDPIDDGRGPDGNGAGEPGDE